MFPPESFAVGVAVDWLEPPPGPDVLPEGVMSSRPARIGDLLSVASMTPEQKAFQLQRVQQAEAMLAGYRVELVVGLAEDRPASMDRRRGQRGGASGQWADDPLDEDTSEFFADELAMVLNCSRTAATQQWEQSVTLLRRLPVTWAALADGRLDWSRARAIADELGWPARETPDDVVAAVEAAVLPQAAGLSIKRLRALAHRQLIAADPGAAERRGTRAQRAADVTVRGIGDGLGEVRATLPLPEAEEIRARTDADARAAKAAGDERPIGQLRGVALHARVTGAGQDRPAVSAHVEVVASLDTLEAAAAGAPGVGREPVLVGGEPVTTDLAREYLQRLDALCPGGLQAPAGGGLMLSVVDAGGRLLACVTRRELETAVRHGRGLCRPPAVDRYAPSPGQRRFTTTRDRTCRHYGCSNRAGWADLDHVLAHAEGGETDCTNLCCLCRRHHRLKTHAHGWRYVMTPDGVLTITTPSGVTRVSRPPGMTADDDDPSVLRVTADRDPDPPPF